jgi:hypothetical protein
VRHPVKIVSCSTSRPWGSDLPMTRKRDWHPPVRSLIDAMQPFVRRSAPVERRDEKLGIRKHRFDFADSGRT